MAKWRKFKKAIKATGLGDTILAALNTKKGRKEGAAALATALGKWSKQSKRTPSSSRAGAKNKKPAPAKTTSSNKK